ncbi:MAG: hypothetical protein ACI38Q_04665 [Candidatus Bruticola sp.]
MSKFSLAICSAALACILATPALADPSDISGMTNFNQNSIVTISDVKAKSEKPRLHILHIKEEKGTTFLPIEVSAWDISGDSSVQRASDLEAICQVPGRPYHFYTFESGYWKGGAGRAFELEVGHDPYSGWIARVVNVFYPFPEPQDGTTADHLQIEGCASLQDGQQNTYIFLGLRGDSDHPGQLVVGRLEGSVFTEIERKNIDLRSFFNGGRSCSDLNLQPMGINKFRILSVGTIDKGDLGPFDSVICEIGTVELQDKGYKLSMHKKPIEKYRINGLKVESLCSYFGENSDLCIGTDDEAYHVVFRPLPRLESKGNK